MWFPNISGYVCRGSKCLNNVWYQVHVSSLNELILALLLLLFLTSVTDIEFSVLYNNDLRWRPSWCSNGKRVEGCGCYVFYPCYNRLFLIYNSRLLYNCFSVPFKPWKDMYIGIQMTCLRCFYLWNVIMSLIVVYFSHFILLNSIFSIT